jgi:hypothetical protein
MCIPARRGYIAGVTAVSFDVPALVSEVAEDPEGYFALQAALTAAAVEHVRRHNPDQLADIVSRAVAEIDRDVVTGLRGA